MLNITTLRITAQVAVEAIVNHPDDYEAATIAAVRADAESVGVSSFYLDMLPPTPEQEELNRQAEALARVTGSVGATVIHERRNADGSLTVEGRGSYTRPTA